MFTSNDLPYSPNKAMVGSAISGAKTNQSLMPKDHLKPCYKVVLIKLSEFALSFCSRTLALHERASGLYPGFWSNLPKILSPIISLCNFRLEKRILSV